MGKDGNGGRPRADEAQVYGPYHRSSGWRRKNPRRRPWRVIFRVHGAPDLCRTYWRRADAEAAAATMRASIAAAKGVQAADARDGYLEMLRAEGKEESTVRDAGYRLAPLVRRVKMLIEIRPEHIRQRLADVKSGAGKHGTLWRTRHWLQWCIAQGWIRDDPTKDIKVTKRKRKGKDKARLMTREAIILDAALRKMLETGEKTDHEQALAILLYLYTGLRRCEVLELQIRCIDDARGRLDLTHSKTDAGLRAVELPQWLLARLVKWCDGRGLTDWIFPSPRSVSGHRGITWIRKNINKLTARIGLPHTTPHGIRRTHTDLAEEAGATCHFVAKALGHDNPAVTREHYERAGLSREMTQKKALKALEGGKKDGDKHRRDLVVRGDA